MVNVPVSHFELYSNILFYFGQFLMKQTEFLTWVFSELSLHFWTTFKFLNLVKAAFYYSRQREL
jgi:hypothetical protein